MKILTHFPLASILSRASAWLIVSLVLASASLCQAKPHAFSSVIVFGDSLSDNGNLHALTGGLIPPPPYFQGRFCNGPVWVEHLAGVLNAPLRDYAVGGATTGHFNSNEPLVGADLPGLQDEIQTFLTESAGSADPDALYIVWAGANDFFVTLQTGGNIAVLFSTAVANTVQAVGTLAAAGARHIVVPNLPDLGVTPQIVGIGAGGTVSYLVAQYNQVLAGAIQSLAGAGIDAIMIDSFATLDAMVYSPGDYGFSDVTHPYLAVGGNVNEFLFWDRVHPTTRAHEVLASDALAAILGHFSPSNGKGNPPARINSLNGLVHKK